ncbi:6057_t:CDS:2, partial [Ambispora leptoticha]
SQNNMQSTDQTISTTASTFVVAGTNSFQRFDHQIGGHEKILSMGDGSVIAKPCNTIERDFYENSVLHPEFAQWMPRYLGSLQLKGVQSHLDTIATNVIDSAKTYVEGGGNDTVIREQNAMDIKHAICIENVIWKFKKPCIMDLKLGFVLYGPEADEAKRQRMIKKAESSTSGTVGLRIAAMKLYEKSKNDFTIIPRTYGYALTKDTMLSGFTKYFDALQDSPPHNHKRVIIKRFLDDLQEFRKVLEKQELRLHSASLLFVYEGDEKALTDALELEKQDFDGKKSN